MARRRTEVFGLSFLDCICCGFGATVLLYTILNAAAKERVADRDDPRRAEVDRLEREALAGQARLVELRNSVRESERQRAVAQGLARRVRDSLAQVELELATFSERNLAKREHLNRLKTDVRSLEEGAARLSGGGPSDETPGDRTRAFVGDGDRQYLTGLKLGGKRILLLVDASASMLADTIVNAVRRRHLPDLAKLQADKWRHAVRSVDWLLAQVPRDARFQVYVFSTEARPLIPGTQGVWLEGGDRKRLDDAVARLRQTAAQGGTSLEAAFAAARALNPAPDNILLLTDGLPTQGRTPPRERTVSARQRLRLFERALEELPKGVPVNTILFPMEGDPMAPSAFWKLAMATGGSFLTPSSDWP